MPGISHQTNARIPALEGLRGLALLLVVLSHLWVVYPFDGLENVAPLDGWFRSGSVGVSIFLVLSGFLVTRSLLSAHGRDGPSGAALVLLRRFLRISAQVYLVLVAVVVLADIDSTDTASEASTTNSARTIATYTWNWYVREHAMEARSDLGHLWYLSVELHVFLALAIAIALWGKRRLALISAVVGLIVAVTWWRWHAYDVEGWYSASLRTTTRADAALYGILAGLLWDRAQAWRHEAASVLGAATLVIIGVVLSTSQLDIGAYFKVQGIVIAVAATLFVMAASVDESTSSPAARIFAASPLRILGTVSLPLYVWHLPVYWFISRHTTSWSNLSRTLVTIVTLGALVFLLHRFVDEPVRRWTSMIRRSHAETARTV